MNKIRMHVTEQGGDDYSCHVQRIRAQVVREAGVAVDLVGVDAQLLHDDVLDLLCYGHRCFTPCEIRRARLERPENQTDF